MKKRTVFYLGGMVVVAGCGGAILGFSEGQTGVGLDSYFATNVGRLAGHAEALASICPSLTFNEAELELNRKAICEAGGLGADCSLPGLDAEKTKSFDETMASLEGVPVEQVCADTRAEAAGSPPLADYLIGLQVVRRAVVPVPAPVVEPEEPGPEEPAPEEPGLEEPAPEEPAPEEPAPEEPAPEEPAEDGAA